MDAASYRDFISDDLSREKQARSLHWNTTVVLGYNNIPLNITPEGFDAGLILNRSSLCCTSLDRLILGGIKVIVWSPGIPWHTPSGEGLCGRAKVDFLQGQLRVLNDLNRLTDGILQLARNAGEIRRINAAGGIAVLAHLSSVSHLNDLGILREYYDLGVRMIHCAFQDWPEDAAQRTTVNYGPTPREVIYDAGKLNPHGVKTIEEMKRLGIIVDVAHEKPEGFDDVVPRLEGLPFVYSHGGCGALYPDVRNFDDERIARVAANGGVYGIGVCIGPVRVYSAGSGNDDITATARQAESAPKISASAKDIRDYIMRTYSHAEAISRGMRNLKRSGAFPVKPHMSTVVEHMKYLREKFGPDIVGYGPDYEHSYNYWRGLDEADKTPALTRALLEAGFSASEVQGALGHNFMRVYEAVLK